MKSSKQGLSRRQFLKQSLQGAGLAVAAGAGLALSQRLARGAEAAKTANPFAYDVSKISTTDPKLVRFETAGRFTCPDPDARRVAVGPESHLYVAAQKGILILTPTGALLRRVNTAAPARCLAVAADGTLYAGLRDRVQVFDSKGVLLNTWTMPGPKTWLTGLAVSETALFAADASGRVILQFDRAGKLLGRLGEKNAQRAIPGLIVPSPYLDVKLGPDGLLRVNNPGRHCVETYTAQGDLELSWGKPTAAMQGFCGCCNPIGLAVLPDGRILTCEKGLPRVKLYSAQGTFDCVVAGTEAFPQNAQSGGLHDVADGVLAGLDAAVTPQGHIYVLDRVTGEIQRFQPKTA